MAKKVPDLQRFERMFATILDQLGEPEDKHTRCIVEALKVIALEISELNVAASASMEVPEILRDVAYHLEQIDAQTDEVAEHYRSQTS